MDKDTYYYSLVTSPYITHAAFFAQNRNSQKVLVIVEIRDKKGEFVSGINYCDLGGLISKDYLPIAYNFSNTKALFVIPGNFSAIKLKKNSQKRCQILILDSRSLNLVLA